VSLSAWLTVSLRRIVRRLLGPDQRTTTALALGWLLLSITFNAYYLWPEIGVQAPDLNDSVYHLGLIERAAEVAKAGGDVADHWVSYWTMGYPVFHHYQHLPHVTVVLVHRLLSGCVSQELLFKIVKYLFLVLFPLSVFYCLRRLDFSPIASSLAASLASCFSTHGLYGFGFMSYTWGGFGLYTQLWGMFFLPLALGKTYSTLKSGKGHFVSALLLSATLLSHLIYGYIVVFEILLMALLKPFAWKKVKRAGVVLLLAGLMTSYFVIPLLADSQYANKSMWEKRWKWDSFGCQKVLSDLWHGELFDYGRFPVLTLLTIIGVLCAFSKADKRRRFALASFLFWLFAYFGRETWGYLADLLPASEKLHFHRLIGGVHLGSILLIAVAFEFFRERVSCREKRSMYWAVLVVLPLVGLMLFAIYKDRALYLNNNQRWAEEAQEALADDEEMRAAISFLRTLPPGRVYPGRGGNWGKHFKVGAVPVYALVSQKRLDALSFMYNSMSPNSDIQVFFDESRKDHYNLFNVRYVLADERRSFPDFVKLLRSFGRYRVYEAPSSGYFDLVNTATKVSGSWENVRDFNVQWLKSPSPGMGNFFAINPPDRAGGFARDVQLKEAATFIFDAQGPAKMVMGAILGEQVRRLSYSCSVEAKKECFLLFKMSYHPNWRAVVDGRESPTLMLSPYFVGVRLGPGLHEIRMVYEAQSWRALLILIGLVSGLVALVWPWVQRRQRRPLLPAGAFSRSRVVFEAIRESHFWTKMAAARKKHLTAIALILCLGLVAALPLLKGKHTSGHDALEYVPRLVEFEENVRNGILLPRWAPDLSRGYGQPFLVFNPPLLYYIAEMFRAMGLGFVDSINFSCVLVLILSGLGMYLFASEFFGRLAGLVAAVAYMYAPYVLTDLFVRAAFAEFVGFVWPPLILWSLWRAAKGSRCFLYAFWAGLFYALLILSHNCMSLMFTPVIAAFILFIWVRQRGRKSLVFGFGSMFLGLCLSSFFWIPALLEKHLTKASSLLEGYLNYRNHFVFPHQFLHSKWGYGLSLAGPNDGMSFAIGYVHLALAVLAVVIMLRKPSRSAVDTGRDITLFVASVGVIASLLATSLSLPLWEHLPLLKFMQFPWRFLAPVAMCVSFLCGCAAFVATRRLESSRRLIVAAIILGIVLANLPLAVPEKYYETKWVEYPPERIAAEGVAVTTRLEYEPIFVKRRPQIAAPPKAEISEGLARLSPIASTPTVHRFSIDAEAKSKVCMNVFFFPGWEVLIDGKRQPIEVEPEVGTFSFDVPPGLHNVVVRFSRSPSRLVGELISVVAVMFCAGLLLWPRSGPRTGTGEGSRPTQAADRSSELQE